MMSRAPLGAGEFEYESLKTLEHLGYRPERLDGHALSKRFPSWNGALYVDGFYHAVGGFARSDLLIQCLREELLGLEVEFHLGMKVDRLLERGDRVTGVVTEDGMSFEAEATVLAAGAWTPRWLPELGAVFRTVAQPVFYLKPADPAPFMAAHFPVFTADIRRTGWYGCPADNRGIVKLANHGPGLPWNPDQGRNVPADVIGNLRSFLTESFPALSPAPLAGAKLCLYCDAADGDFWITPHPERPGLTLATGGSGHAFKFAPLIGGWIADAVEGIDHPVLQRFRWRRDDPPVRSAEAARFSG